MTTPEPAPVEAEVEALRDPLASAKSIIATMGRPTPVAAMAMTLFEAWVKADPTSAVARHPASFIATFVDVARAALTASQAEAAALRAERDEARAAYVEAQNARNQNLAAALAAQTQAAALQKRVVELEGALAFYADPVSYALTQISEPRSAAHGDGGRRARNLGGKP